MNELFLKNMQELFMADEPLAYRLREFMLKNKPSYEILNDENGVNLVKNNVKLYEKNELKEQLELFKNEYSKYPVLFIYGFGNAELLKELLKNKNHKYIIVFEDDIEILSLGFSLCDFTKDLKTRLILFYPPSINTAQLTTLFGFKIVRESVKIFNLFIQSEFYAKLYHNEILSLKEKLLENIRFIVLSRGNDPKDSLIGIEHMLDNLKEQLKHGIFQEFLKQNRAKHENAIIVSTGPSLTKQLPLLKANANKAVIFCADSSYPILAKHGIVPDYVLSLERVIETSEFFNNDFKEFNKNILFIPASLVHKNTIEYLKKDDREFMLVHRPLNSAASLKLDEYGYIGVGMSVANMAFELAGALTFKNIILIGQDLAYDESGKSHPKEHIYGEQGDEFKEGLKTIAYGGVGVIKTQLSWNLFRKAFERDILLAKNKLKINTYNATEGGARIEEAIEKPFSWVCENLLKEEVAKPLEFPRKPGKEEFENKFSKVQSLLRKNVKEAKDFIQKSQNELKKLKYELEKKELNFKTLEKIRLNLAKFFDEFEKLKLFNELTQATHFHNKLELVKFEVLKEEKQKELLVEFLKTQYNWFLNALGYLQTQNKAIEERIENV